VNTRHFNATTDFSRLAEVDVILICVPTPLDEYHQPDLSYVSETVRSIAPHLQEGQLIVLESTTYPGTTEEIVVPILEGGSGLIAGTDFYLGYSPERVDPGNKTWGLTNIPKVVSGVNQDSLRVVQDFYRMVVSETIAVSGTREAELTKLLENTFRCVNIALVNELKMLSDTMGIDVWEVVEAASTKPFGFMRF